MPRSSLAQRPSPTEAPWCDDDLLPQLLNTMALLAEMDTRHQLEEEQLQAWSGPRRIKKRLTAQLEERFQRDREPYVQKLAELHHRMWKVMTLQDICSAA